MPGTLCGYDNLSCDILSGEVRSVEVLEKKRSESRGEELCFVSCCPQKGNKLLASTCPQRVTLGKVSE